LNSSGGRSDYQILLSKAARDVYEAADAPLQRRFNRCFDTLRTIPTQHPNIKPLKGRFSGHYRFRVGDYRVVYRIDGRGRLIIVVIIAHRSEAYG
jgi:mRNA interferase RelE/StbE